MLGFNLKPSTSQTAVFVGQSWFKGGIYGQYNVVEWCRSVQVVVSILTFLHRFVCVARLLPCRHLMFDCHNFHCELHSLQNQISDIRPFSVRKKLSAKKFLAHLERPASVYEICTPVCTNKKSTTVTLHLFFCPGGAVSFISQWIRSK